MNTHFVSPLDLLIFLRSIIGGQSGMARSDLAHLAEIAREVPVRKGQALLAAGDPVDAVYIVVEGAFEVDAGDYVEVIEARRGFNWLRFHGGFETCHAATAVVDSLVLELPTAELSDHLEGNPAMVEGILRRYARQLLELRSSLPAHPDEAERADPGTPPPGPLGLVERLNRVAKPGGWWHGHNLDAVVTIVREMEELHFDAGETMWEVGTKSPYFWIVVSGTVACTNAEGESVEVGADFGLGSMDAFADVPRSYGAVATRPVVALRSNVGEMMAVMEHHSDMAMALLRGISRLFHDAYGKQRSRELREASEAKLAG